MKKLREQLLRWTLLVRKIQAQPGIAFKALQRELERELTFRGYEPVCSDATLKRDLAELREEFGIDITYSRTQGGYTLHDTGREWPDMERLIEPLELLTALGTDSGLPDCIWPETYPVKGTQHLSALVRAIREHRRVAFHYRKYSGTGAQERTLSPYALKEWRGRWYVVGQDEQGLFKTFGLDRMDALWVGPDTFVPDASFDLRRKFADSFGIYSSEEYPLEEVVVAVDAEDAGYLRSRPLHASQEVAGTCGGETLFRFRLRLTPDFVMELLSRSWSLRVVQPAALREQMCRVYEEALRRNRRD